MEEIEGKIQKFLEMNPEEWFTTKEIGIELEISTGDMLKSLARLYKYNEILRRQKTYRSHLYVWRFKTIR